jgi:hypothetical protein
MRTQSLTLVTLVVLPVTAPVCPDLVAGELNFLGAA